MKRVLVRGLASLCLLGVMSAGCVIDADDAELAFDDPSIINGTPSTAGKFPTVVGIFMRLKSDTTGKGAVCTGTLISPTAVLTAAHCVDPKMLRPFGPPPTDAEWIVTFDLDIRTSTQRLAVARVDKHAGFGTPVAADNPPADKRGPGRWDDIGIIHLAQPVTGRTFQKLAFGDEATRLLKVDDTYVVAGYGQISNEDKTAAGVLTNGTSKLNGIGRYEIAVGDLDNQQACHGDSGGPVFTQAGVQLGIASRINIELSKINIFDPPKCVTGLLYTRVDAYEAWIKERVKDFDGRTPNPSTPDAGVDNPGTGEGDDGAETGGCGCDAGADRGGALLALGVAMTLFWPRRRHAR